MSGRWQYKRNGQHPIQTSSTWLYMGLLTKNTNKYGKQRNAADRKHDMTRAKVEFHPVASLSVE
jgi:hypothetical protein